MNKDIFDQTISFYTGSYAKPGEEGVVLNSLDLQTGACTMVSECTLLENPSYLLCHPRKNILYAVEELQPEGRVAALTRNGDAWQTLCAFPTGGADPCHLALSPEGKFLFVSNYTSGSLAVFALDEDGVPVKRSDFVQHSMTAAEKRGANPARQEGPHVHFSYCDGTRVFVCDLGLDKVLVYGWDSAHGKLAGCPEEIGFPKGSGPRHLVLSENRQHLYVICELSMEIHVFARDGETWRRIQVISAVPEEFRTIPEFFQFTGAAIRIVHNDTLMASTRGHDSISLFRIAEDGRLSERKNFSAEGRTPRDFQVLGEFLLTANQDSGNLSVFRRNPETGTYDFTRHVPHGGSPSCICPIPENR